MISFSVIKAPHSNYLGERVFYKNQLTIGNEGSFHIRKAEFIIPLWNLKIQEDKLILSGEQGELEIYLNGKTSKLPLIIKLNDVLTIEDFVLRFGEFKRDQFFSTKKKLNQALEEAQKKPMLMRLISHLTTRVD